MKKKSLKLSLKKETVATLSKTEIKSLIGAGAAIGNPLQSDVCPIVCYVTLRYACDTNGTACSTPIDDLYSYLADTPIPNLTNAGPCNLPSLRVC